MKAKTLYGEAKAALAQAGHTAAVEANVLFETAVGRPYVGIGPDADVDEADAQKLRQLTARRVAGEPLQYIAGSWPFLDFDLVVGPGVLIPRPETERAAQTALAYLAGQDAPVLVDLCSGSGCIAIALQRALPDSDVTAVELYDDAFYYLTRNARRLAPAVHTVQDDVLGYEAKLPNDGIDLIVANPPYVTPDEYEENHAELAHEPCQAFLGGPDGLDFYRYIIEYYHPKLRPGGRMLFETGFNQTDAVAALFYQAGYEDVRMMTDDAGLPRMVSARRKNRL